MSRTMEPVEAAATAVLAQGKTVKVTVGEGPDDPVLLVWRAGDVVMCESIGGWSAGAREQVCGVGSDYLEREFLKGPRRLELTDQEPPGGRGVEE